MKCEITPSGKLMIEPENDTELYAIRIWVDRAVKTIHTFERVHHRCISTESIGLQVGCVGGEEI